MIKKLEKYDQQRYLPTRLMSKGIIDHHTLLKIDFYDSLSRFKLEMSFLLL